jgi:glycosyltransferase involved in cell wall biosynthesis
MTYLIIAMGLLAGWALFAVRGWLGMRRVPVLADLPQPADSAGMPLLSVVIPARNEEASVRACLESLLAQDYASLEIIAVDDRSTDATGAILDEVAAASGGRLAVIHICEVPDGWLGKCNALAVGAAKATGEFILFTDGDVVYEPTALGRAMVHVVAENADMLVVMPDMITHSTGERIIILGFAQAFFMAYEPWKAMDRRSPAYIGAGAFNLVRRSLYARCGGHRFLRLQVIDDVGLGKIIKHAGGIVRVVVGRGMVHVRWQDSLAGTIRGLEKNGFAAMGYSAARALAAICVFLFASLWPWAGMFVGPPWARIMCAVVALVIQPSIGVAGTRLARMHWGLAFTLPLGSALIGWAMLRSTVVTLHQGGIRWRDHFYPLKDLRRHKL